MHDPDNQEEFLHGLSGIGMGSTGGITIPGGVQCHWMWHLVPRSS